ncbi:MAG: hypothetical protein GX144_09110 [Clostridiaceae bacterium]|nr:hypothetical protein [Clostridiaceae bacterium]
MKITDLAILFIIIILPFVQILRIQSDNLQNTVYKNMTINRYLDTAVEDASEAMIVRGANQNLSISRDKALAAFNNTLLTNFQVLGDETATNLLMAYIPVMILIDYDGYWVCSMEEYLNSDGDREEKMIWKPKKPYSYESNDFVYLFTLDKNVRVLEISGNQVYEGTQENLKAILHTEIIQQDGLFETVRKRTIVEAIEKDVNEAINKHNVYARRFGITYQFSPPTISDADWHNNIEDIGFLAFFQGIPIGIGGERYNNFALGASRIVRSYQYYIQQEPNGLLYYHRENCSQLTKKEEVYDTREECALEGAFPCHICKP